MPAIASLVVGRVYFMATYEDPKFSRPIVLSFEYLGKDIHGEPLSANDSHFYFNFLPPFRSADAESKVAEENCLHMFPEQDAVALHDLEGLLFELQKRQASWLQSGRQAA